MKTIFSIIVLVLFHNNILNCQENELRTEIDKLIRYDTEIDYKKTPGFIISVIDNDQTYHYSFGSKIVGKKIHLTSDDIFEIGSVSKVFTSNLITKLVDENLVKLEENVNTYIPEEWQNPRLDDLTLYDLINHLSGFPRRPSFFGKNEKDPQNPYASYSRDELLKFYRDYLPEGKKFEYSHTNYALLEIVIEKVTGKTFQDIMDEKIFKPLSMSNSFIDFPEEKENYISPGYDRSRKKVSPWMFESFKASEGVKSSASDLCKFVKNYLNETEFSKYPSSAGFNKGLSVILGWHAIHMNDFDILTHTGKTSGHNAFIALVRETKTAVIVLSNSSIGTEDLGLQILRMINFNWKRIKA